MADPFATSADVESAWRALSTDEAASATYWLTFASAIIRREVPTVDARITAGTLDADLVMGVAVSMVLRRLQNPDGYRSVQESIEDYSTTATRDSALSAGGVYLNEDEKCLLGERSGAFSITPTAPAFDDATAEKVWAKRHSRTWVPR
jgi:hypothetical protein